MTYVDDYDKPFKITGQSCNLFVICVGKSGEILHIIFIYAYMYY